MKDKFYLLGFFAAWFAITVAVVVFFKLAIKASAIILGFLGIA